MVFVTAAAFTTILLRRAFASGVSKRPQEALRVLVVMDPQTHNGRIIQQCMSEHSKQTDTQYLVAQTASEVDRTQVADVDVVLHAIFAGGDPKVIHELWPSMPKVRWVHSLSTGVDALVPVLRECNVAPGLPVTNAKGAFDRSLAEWCITAFLHFNKQLVRVGANRQAKKWDKFIMNELAGKNVGFLGFGSIAQATAKLCRAFGMNVIALRRRVQGPGSEVADQVYGFDEKEKFFGQCDFAVCSLPATESTYHFCDAAAFQAMKESGVFVSIGRGTCVDEIALEEALKKKAIAGAALDVFEKEPLSVESGLWDCENLLLTAHNADNTESYIQDAWRVYLENFELFMGNQKMATIDLKSGY